MVGVVLVVAVPEHVVVHAVVGGHGMGLLRSARHRVEPADPVLGDDSGIGRGIEGQEERGVVGHDV